MASPINVEINPRQGHALSSPRKLEAANLIYKLVDRQSSPSIPKLDHTFTDHMLICKWNKVEGWSSPEIVPYGALSIMPGASALQYAAECFEGMKAYRGYDGKLRLFRPNKNAERMLMSSSRAGLPSFDPKEFEKLVRMYSALEAPRWLPQDATGETLYLRPTHIGTNSTLGVQKPADALLYIIATRMSGFSSTDGMRLITSADDIFRAWPGGFGFAKLGANYGPTLVAHGEAIKQGFDQVLWLFGPERYITEAGASNFFVVWRTREGKVQLVTAGLENKTILDGVTRNSVINLANERLKIAVDNNGTTLEPLEVVERNFSVAEVQEAAKEGRLIEAFASGTAYFIAPVKFIQHKNEGIVIPRAAGGSGYYTALIKSWLSDIVFGKMDYKEWAIIIE